MVSGGSWIPGDFDVGFLVVLGLIVWWYWGVRSGVDALLCEFHGG